MSLFFKEMDAFNDKLVFLFMSYKEPFYAVILNLVLLHCLCNVINPDNPDTPFEMVMSLKSEGQ